MVERERETGDIVKQAVVVVADASHSFCLVSGI